MTNGTIATAGACLTLFVGIAIIFSNVSDEIPGSPVKLPLTITKTKLSFTALFLKIKIFFMSVNRMVYYPTYKGFQKQLTARCKVMSDTDSVTVKVKTIYFVRHGQSIFNDLTVNRNVFVVFFKTIRLILFETFLLFTNEVLTYDSPLSSEGISQAMNAAQFLSSHKNQNDPDIAILNGKSTVPSVLFSSFLRRSQGTTALLFQSRLTSNDENIYVTHELDEVVRNPDCVSMHTVFKSITFPLLEQLFSPQSYYRYLRLRMVENDPYMIKTPYVKVIKFFDRIFHKFDEDVIIAVGHSRWIRFAMRVFFPPNSVDLDVLNKKLTNVGILKFDVHLKKNLAGEHSYTFDPKSFRIIYGSFK
ncbi:hypothetical protein MACK_001664 [Theileria orientalis]|uniref:Phosphoglycerate mutase n=1 Tax=Theileria orientalis TaxID=68886 RepID=A0A976QXC1_THEOR|nr:hypothetical protein MACK_001664 [Theileria orientalis]